ncbi:MAG: hypothetical protein JRE40_02000 [Deltaproteobacteria bacterium]|nr:hypothetical protein [Deltaproteobacteria bacterium]
MIVKAGEYRRIGQAREGEERGRGVPLTDVERVMRHYNVDYETACYWLSIHTVDELLPERGTGLSQDLSPIEQMGKTGFYAILTGLGLGIGFYIIHRIAKGKG